MWWVLGHVYAAGVTAMPAAGAALQGESQTWGYYGILIALAVGILSVVASRMNHDFLGVFAWVLQVVGAGAFIAAAIILVGLVGLVPGATGESPVETNLAGEFFALLVGGLIFALPLIGLLGKVVHDIRSR